MVLQAGCIWLQLVAPNFTFMRLDAPCPHVAGGILKGQLPSPILLFGAHWNEYWNSNA
jgi:hypothetical protein